jgi:hypothetical protein
LLLGTHLPVLPGCDLHNPRGCGGESCVSPLPALIFGMNESHIGKSDELKNETQIGFLRVCLPRGTSPPIGATTGGNNHDFLAR